MRNILMATVAVFAMAGVAGAEQQTVTTPGGISEVSWTGAGKYATSNVDAGTYSFGSGGAIVDGRTTNPANVTTTGVANVVAFAGPDLKLYHIQIPGTDGLFAAAASVKADQTDNLVGNGAGPVQTFSNVDGRAVAAGDLDLEKGTINNISGIGENPNGIKTPTSTFKSAAVAKGDFGAVAQGFSPLGVSSDSTTNGGTNVGVAGVGSTLFGGGSTFAADSYAHAKNVTVGLGYAESRTAVEANASGVAAATR